MRLDYDLIRKVMLQVEGEEEVNLDGYTNEQVEYHTYHLIKAGYVSGAADMALSGDYFAVPNDLTWEGHQFLANARNDKVWKRSLSEVAAKGGSISIDILTRVLTQVALQTFGLT